MASAVCVHFCIEYAAGRSVGGIGSWRDARAASQNVDVRFERSWCEYMHMLVHCTLRAHVSDHGATLTRSAGRLLQHERAVIHSMSMHAPAASLGRSVFYWDRPAPLPFWHFPWRHRVRRGGHPRRTPATAAAPVRLPFRQAAARALLDRRRHQVRRQSWLLIPRRRSLRSGR